MKIISVVMVVAVLICCVAFCFIGCSKVTDHSLKYDGNYYYWQGRRYVQTSGEYTYGELLATSEGGKYPRLCSVEQDPSNTFVIICYNGDNRDLYVSTDYTVPESGKATIAMWGFKTIRDEDFLNVMDEIMAHREVSFECDLGSVYYKDMDLSYLTLGYEGCPVATDYVGRIGTLYGEWILTIPPKIGDPITSPNSECYRIPEQYAAILKECRDRYW